MEKEKIIQMSDALTKKLLSHKLVLAHVLKASIPEFKNVDIDTIMNQHIVSVNKDGDSIESKNVEIIIDDKKVLLDMCVEILLPNSHYGIVDLEMQKKFYDIDSHLSRSTSYISALILNQFHSLTGRDKYKKLSSVYSIWLFLDPPKQFQGTITEFYQTYRIRSGKDWVNEKVHKAMDLSKTVFIFLSDNGKMKVEEINILSAIFNEKMNYLQRRNILDQNNIPEYIKEEVTEKMDVGKSIWEEAERKGKREGRKAGREEGLKAGREEGSIETTISYVKRLMEKGFTLENIIHVLELDDQMVQIINSKLKIENIPD